MNTYRRAFSLLVATAPLINFTVFPGSNLALAYLIALFIVLLIALLGQKIPITAFGTEDAFFLLFISVAFTSFLINLDQYPAITGLYQVINLTLTYLIFKTALIVLYKSGTDSNEILSRIFKINSYYAVLAIILYFVGLANPALVEKITLFFNNAGNFTTGGIGYSFGTARSFGFAPEPSFWSFFVAVNLALGLVLKGSSRLLLMVNIINLILTFGRTGYLIAASIFVIKFFKVSFTNRMFIIGLLFIVAYNFIGQVDVESLKAVDDSFSQRIDSLLVALSITNDNLLFGIGLGNFRELSIARNLAYHDIFNLFLSLLVSSGVLGFFFFTTFLLIIFSKIDRPINLPFYASVIGWMTVSAYNLPYIWLILSAMLYHSNRTESNGKVFEA